MLSFSMGAGMCHFRSINNIKTFIEKVIKRSDCQYVIQVYISIDTLYANWLCSKANLFCFV